MKCVIICRWRVPSSASFNCFKRFGLSQALEWLWFVGRALFTEVYVVKLFSFEGESLVVFKIFENGWIDLYNDVLWANYSILEDVNIKCANYLNVNVYVKYSVRT